MALAFSAGFAAAGSFEARAEEGEIDGVPELVAGSAEVPPVIDGVLDDACWVGAPAVSGFRQRDPDEGDPATERTIVRVTRDRENLYLAFRCFDSAPEKINHTVMQRDATVGSDDYIFVVLDPYRRGREGFYFRVNANGAMGDGKIDPRSSRPRMEWDAIWDAAGRIDERGWTVELKLPFQSLYFDPDETEWAVNFGRFIPRKQERIRWTAAIRNRGFFELEDAGRLTGLTGIEKGLGIDVKPFVSTRWIDDKDNGHDGDFEFDPGLDASLRIGPSMTATLTVNTDFAEAEVDQRRVNLTRFPLFFPEKRDFFLEAAENFEFGGISRSPLAFHSRTVGLSAGGEKIDILAGGKLTGRAGRLGVGLLGVALDDLDGLEGDQAYVGRLTYDVLEESRVGTMFTVGDPRRNADNHLIGFDFNYKDSRFIDDNQLNINTWVMASDTGGEKGNAYGVELSYPNTPWYLDLDLTQIDEAFRPAMGFVQREGIRSAEGFVRYRFFPESVPWIQEFDIRGMLDLFTDLDNNVETVSLSAPGLSLETPAGNEFYIVPDFQREVLTEDFEIIDGNVIPEGDYRFNDIRFGIETTSSRPLAAEVSVRTGEFFDGHRHSFESELVWRACSLFRFDIGGEWNVVDLPGGEFDAIVGFTGFRVTPNPRLSWNTVVQYDNISDEVGINSRIRYIFNPGSDVFLVFNKGFAVEDGEFRSLVSEASAKVGWTFRF